MSTEPRKGTEQETEQIAMLAEPFIEAMMSLPGQLGLHVLCYTSAAMVMNAVTTIPKVEAWDHVAACVRRTIEENLKAGLQ